MSSEIDKIGNKYADAYLKWKSWGAEFGKLKKIDFSYYQSEISRIGCSLPKNSKVLEIGFGDGCFLQYARQREWDVHGLEANAALVEMAQQHGFNATHGEKLSSFPNNSFDLVIAIDVLEHIPQDSLETMLLEIHRILKRGGFFIARFPNGDSPLGLSNQNGDLTHITALGSGKITYLAKKTNLEIIYLGGEAEPFFGGSLKYLIRKILSWPIRTGINQLMNFIFFPRKNIAYCSINLTAVFRVDKA